MKRYFISIDSRPAGEAPEWVRDQWIGLHLPLVKGHEGCAYEWPTGSILTDQNSLWSRLKNLLGTRPKFETWTGFFVCSEEAIATLEKHARKEAADWWRNNVTCGPSIHWLFDAGCCRLLPPAKTGASEQR